LYYVIFKLKSKTTHFRAMLNRPLFRCHVNKSVKAF